MRLTATINKKRKHVYNTTIIRRKCEQRQNKRSIPDIEPFILLDNIKILILMLDYGLDIEDCYDCEGNALLYNAVRDHYEDIVALILNRVKNVDITAGNDGGSSSPLTEAAVNDHKEILKRLLYYGIKMDTRGYMEGETFLHYMAQFRQIECIEILLAHGYSVNSRDCGGYTPLHLAVDTYGELDAIKLLISHGADISAETEEGDTPLHIAAYYGHNVIEYLLSLGANINAQNIKGETPLHKATRCGNIENVTLLLINGADKNLKTIKGEIPYDLARTDEIRSLLGTVNTR